MLRKLVFQALMAGGIFTVFLLAVSSGLASASITVTTTGDTIADDGQCSLREAVIATNTDTAFGGCPAGNGGDTIEFSAGLSVPFTITLTTSGANEDASLIGDLDIIGNLTIVGAGSTNTFIDGDHSDRIFDILTGSHVTLTNMTVQNGDPGGGASGAGIQVVGSLTLNNSIVRANQGDGISNWGGGLVLNYVQVSNNLGSYGIRNQNQGVLTINGGVISGNQGGGVYNNNSTVTMTNLLISNNSGGSGVYNTGTSLAHLTVSSSSILSNTTPQNGGGIFNEGVGAIASISNTTIRNNSASAAGGGVFNNGVMNIISSTLYQNQARTGGGIDHFGGDLSMTNDTLSANNVLDNGGGLYNRGSGVLTNVTFNANIANGAETGGNIFNDTASLTIKNTIVANSDIDGNCFNSEGFIISLGHNLESGNTCGFTAPGDRVDTPPELGPLFNNGGQTSTHALLAGSPAIDAGDNNGCPVSDQRGVVRPVDGDGIDGAVCDIGAFEYFNTTPIFNAIYLPMIWR